MNSKNNFLATEVADHISAMLAYWDKDMVCRFANSAYVEWFGKTKEDMIDKITLKELLGPLFERNLIYINGALNGEIQTFEREIPQISGGVRYAIANYYPDIVNGKVKGFFAHVAEVTTLKLLEKELRSSNQTIQEQNKRLLNFSNIISHNLKSYSNNLASILNLFITASSETEKNKMLEFLKRISKEFSLTIDHLNEITKAQNLSKTSFERINLNEYIEKSKILIAFQIESSGAIIKNNVDKEITVSANPAYLESILLNLLTNAIKYRHPAKSPIIELTCFTNNDKINLEITDNGKGINLEKHGADLFGMYKTFHGNVDAEGIGLFITKYQIEAMGGQINVKSEENNGTTFTISFNTNLL